MALRGGAGVARCGGRAAKWAGVPRGGGCAGSLVLARARSPAAIVDTLLGDAGLGKVRPRVLPAVVKEHDAGGHVVAI